MARPDTNFLTEEVYREAGPLATGDEAADWPLLAYLQSVLGSVAEAEELARDSDDGPGWSNAVDVDRAPARILQWLGQLYGVRVTPGDPTDSDWVLRARAEIRNAAGIRRGTVGAMEGAVQATLTGTKEVRITERVDGNAYRFLVVTRPSETPDVDATIRAIVSQKPAGLLFEHFTDDFPLVDEMARPIDSITAAVSIDVLTLPDVN